METVKDIPWYGTPIMSLPQFRYSQIVFTPLSLVNSNNVWKFYLSVKLEFQ